MQIFSSPFKKNSFHSSIHLSCNEVYKSVQALSGSWAMFPIVLFPNCAAAPQDL